MEHEYNDAFYEYINAGATASAEVVIKHLLSELRFTSVLDVGCGQGAWVHVWQQLAGATVLGVDGNYVDQGSLLVSRDCFQAHDLVKPLELGRRFDLCQSLEVAEHLPEAAADDFVRTLVSHSEMVLFSAAVPGQGGEFHVNEQPLEYWRSKFRRHGYVPIDFIRPRIAGDRRVAPWYRYNTLLYVSQARLTDLPQSVLLTRVADAERIAEVAPLGYRLRCKLIAIAPVPVATTIAVAKKHLVTSARKVRSLAARQR